MGLQPDLGILLILGIGVFGGILGAWLFQRMKIPQVIGYIAIGLVIGDSGLGILQQENLPSLRPFSFLALAVIGFLVGGELEKKIFKEHGRRFFGIMLGEGLGAFVVVGLASGFLLYWMTGNTTAALAGGVVFGAISSATDPASTLDVLWEYRAKGPLTTGLISVVALDDALAMILYTLGTAVAAMLVGSGLSLFEMLFRVFLELGGSAALGLGTGFMLDAILHRCKNPERSLTVLVGSLLLIAGICLALHLDVILCAMSAGIVLVNRSPQRSKPLFKTVREFASPIQVMFFVLVGARLQLEGMSGWIWLLVAVYVVGRTAGKYVGSYLGAGLTGAPEVLRRNVGMGLFAQGGVAVGLSMMASQHLTDVPVIGTLNLGTLVVSTVTATTLLVQLIGPPFVKHAIQKADEVGRNITEEDLIEQLTVRDTLVRDISRIRDDELLSSVFETVSQSRQLSFPVISDEQVCTGVISLNSLKSLFLERDIWAWMIAEDVMIPVRDDVSPDMPLAEALMTMRQLQAEQTIVRDPLTRECLGLFDLRAVQRDLTRRLISRTGLE